MIFIEHAPYSNASILANFGAPDYSYLFIRNAFRNVLDKLGRRVDVADPKRQVDEIFAAARARAEPCIFLSYNPPQKTVLGLSCPTIPVFAWEYDTIPEGGWDSNRCNDWRTVFEQTRLAITLSREAAQAVRRSMGEDFPVWPIPAPLFETFSGRSGSACGWRDPFELSVEGALAVNVADLDLSRFGPGQPQSDATHALRVLEFAAKADRPAQTLRMEGVVYTTVLCPADGRKNWQDLVGAFVSAFRGTRTATLLFKLTHSNVEDGLLPVLSYISTLGQFDCQIVLINGMLSDQAYAGLIDATSYAVNTALAEGQCLPLTEYMSAGRPAVTPLHSAMLDYVSPDNAFVVRSDARPWYWPHDERRAIRAFHHLTSFTDLVRQYRASYTVARHAPERYAQMSRAAVEGLRQYCSEDVVAAHLTKVMEHVRTTHASMHEVA